MPYLRQSHVLLEAESNLDDSASDNNSADTQSAKEKCLETIVSIAASVHSDSTSTLTGVLPYLTDITKDFVQHGAKITNDTRMMLPDCSRKGKLETIRFLTNVAAVDPNFQGRQGMTALHFAARGGKVEIVKWMLDSCETVDVNVLDGAGKRAVDYAVANGKEEIVDLLTAFETKQS